MSTKVARLSDECGAMVVQVAIAILTLSTFTVLVYDNGALWLARSQAQNAADAGALAGAIARSFDEVTHPVAANGAARDQFRPDGPVERRRACRGSRGGDCR